MQKNISGYKQLSVMTYTIIYFLFSVLPESSYEVLHLHNTNFRCFFTGKSHSVESAGQEQKLLKKKKSNFGKRDSTIEKMIPKDSFYYCVHNEHMEHI